MVRIGHFCSFFYGLLLILTSPYYNLVRFQMMSLEFFTDIILPIRTMALGSTQPLTEMSTRSISWG